MITLAVCSALLGSIVGARFRVLVMLPLVFLGCVGLIAASIAQGRTFLQALSAILVFACFLQLGYICTALFMNAVTPPADGGCEGPQSSG